MFPPKTKVYVFCGNQRKVQMSWQFQAFYPKRLPNWFNFSVFPKILPTNEYVALCGPFIVSREEVLVKIWSIFAQKVCQKVTFFTETNVRPWNDEWATKCCMLFCGLILEKHQKWRILKNQPTNEHAALCGPFIVSRAEVCFCDKKLIFRQSFLSQNASNYHEIWTFLT